MDQTSQPGVEHVGAQRIDLEELCERVEGQRVVVRILILNNSMRLNMVMFSGLKDQMFGADPPHISKRYILIYCTNILKH